MNSSGLLARPKWMNQEKYNDINKKLNKWQEKLKTKEQVVVIEGDIK